MLKKIVAIAVVGAFLSQSAHAQVLDGSIAGDAYGPARSVQTVQTGFGDNASEMNAAYAYTSGGNLHLAITGNIESNFNKLNIFIDSVAGGENVISAAFDNGGSNPSNDGWANAHAGLTFDTGFEADFLLINRNGPAGGPRFDFDFNSVGNTSVSESSTDIFGGSFTGANASVGASAIAVAYDNSNAAGIGGDGSSAADPVAAQAVQTGLEFVIPLSAIGSPGFGDTIKIAAHINGSNHDFLSNQILGGLAAPQSNLGGDGTGNFTGNVGGVDFNNFAGNQYFSLTVVPEPSAAGAICVAAVFGMVRRKKRA